MLRSMASKVLFTMYTAEVAGCDPIEEPYSVMMNTDDIVESIARAGFHCQIEGYSHAYSDQAKFETKANLDALQIQMLTWNEEDRNALVSQIDIVAGFQLSRSQSRECATRLVEGKTGIPTVLYKYLPIERIGRGAPRSLRATQPSALNDVMECSIGTMGGAIPGASEYRAAVGAKLEECFGIAMPDGELAKLWVTHGGEMGLSRLIREHLDSRVGVVSLSRNALVPTMWAHYAKNTGVVVGYDTETLSKLGVELRSTVYLDVAPSYHPNRDDAIEVTFVDRDLIEREAAAGKVVSGYPSLCSVQLTKFSSELASLARLLFVKGKEWAYEQEIRLLVDLQQTRDTGKLDECGLPIRVVDIPPEAIREICQGPRTSKKDMALAVKEARGESLQGLSERRMSLSNFRMRNTSTSRH